MENNITLSFSSKPSIVLSLLKAFKSRKSRFITKESIPIIHVKRENLKIDLRHLKRYNNICKIKPSIYLNILYPFTIVNPYLMRILCQHAMPFSQFKILNTRNSIKMYRQIKTDEIFKVDCYNSEVRIINKGMEIDFKADLFVGLEKVWGITATYYIPGKFGETEILDEQAKLEDIENSSVIKEWIIEAKNRLKFAGISGDTNGIHYSTYYARMFGFKRDYAQPVRITTQCVSDFTIDIGETPVQLDFFLKGPVYYDSILKLKSQIMNNIIRFDLFCEGNDKPCIVGKMIKKKQ